MRLLTRFHIALILAVIYTLIIMSPLTATALNSTMAAHILTGECTGNCASCGCSAASMAAGSCCCMKKQQQAHAREDNKGCSPDFDQRTSERKQILSTTCGCPCGNEENAALFDSETSELLPYYFTSQFSSLYAETSFPLLGDRLALFHGEPPDPPPKI